MKYHSSRRVICVFYRVRANRASQAGGAIITFPCDNARAITLTLAFVVRPSPFATDKFLITRINWPDCNCRCACYRRSRRDASDPAHGRNSLSTAENAKPGVKRKGEAEGGGARLNARDTVGAWGPWESGGTASCAEFRKSL